MSRYRCSKEMMGLLRLIAALTTSASKTDKVEDNAKDKHMKAKLKQVKVKQVLHIHVLQINVDAVGVIDTQEQNAL